MNSFQPSIRPIPFTEYKPKSLRASEDVKVWAFSQNGAKGVPIADVAKKGMVLDDEGEEFFNDVGPKIRYYIGVSRHRHIY